MKDLSSVPWAQMPIYGSVRAHSSLIQDEVLIDGITPDTDEDEAPEPEEDEQPEGGEQ